MIRTTNKEADLILTSDWHLRETTPVCRIDNFWETQWQKVEFVGKLATAHGCPVVHAGDLFHHWKPSPNLIRMAIKHLPTQFYTIYGQHDLPQHNWDLREKSGIATLDEARRVKVLDNCHWGQDPVLEEYPSIAMANRHILVWHKMVWQGKRLWPGQKDPSAVNILRKYPNYDLIVTGDNHIPFVEHYEGRILVNPGSLTRQDADQIDHKPRVYLYYADSNTVVPVYIPIDNSVVQRDHIDDKAEREGRLEAYISRLNQEWTIDLSFERNLDEFFRANKIREDIQKLIYSAIENE